MGIKRKGIRVLEDIIDNRELTYCPRCRKQGWDSILGERIYLPGESIPHDYDLWKQCHDCGQLVPIYEVKKEAKLQDFVETSENPFDQGKTIVGLGNRGKKNKYQKMREKLQERIDNEPELGIKRELRKGNIVEIIE